MRVRIPPADVAPIEIDPVTKRFRWTVDWYDALKNLEKLGLLDLADVTTTTPANGDVLIYDSTNKNFAPGAN
jgi:hypothetical protein